MKPGKIFGYLITGLLMAAQVWALWKEYKKGEKRENVSPMFHPERM